MSALSPTARHEYYVELGNALPPPVLDERELRQRRLVTAVEAFEALRPGDAFEARLAVQIVLTGAHAADSLREAGMYREDFAKRTRCRAQASSMLREERAAKRMLAQEQKLRLAAEAVASALPANPATASAPPPQAELQTERRAEPPPVQAAAAPPQPASAPAVPVPETVAKTDAAIHAAAPRPHPVAPRHPPAALSAPSPVPAGSAPAPSPEAIAGPRPSCRKLVAAAQIRHDRGVTPQNKAYFTSVTLPTDPAVIDALVRGTSDTLTMLDEVGGEMLDQAA